MAIPTFSQRRRTITMSRPTSFKPVKRKPGTKSHYGSEQESARLDSPGSMHGTPVSTNRSQCSFHMDRRIGCLDIDHESEPDRSNPLWKISPSVTSEEEEVVSHVREVSVPKISIWDQLMEEYEGERIMLAQMNRDRMPYEPNIPVGKKLTATQFLDLFIFPILCPALEDTLFMAKKEECLQIQKCVFNGLDHIAELLWNRNPMHPRRRERGYKNIFKTPFVRIWLYDHPRPIYPLSWIWTKEQAIIVLQSYIRRYFICRDPDCYEMRKFWQVFKQEKKEEERLKELNFIEECLEVVSDVLNEIIASAVYKAEWKMHGCFCISKPCHCKCMCMKWCKCCRCYRPEKSIAEQFYSNLSVANANRTVLRRDLSES